MNISIALCTYNGARHLRQQLDSLAAQSHLPHELIVCDDASTDGTPGEVERFAAIAPFPVRLIVNAENLGSTRNFEQAIGLCTGEIIALCDQDDVWHADKLERQHTLLRARPNVGLVFSDAEIVDENLRPLNSRLWKHAGFTSSQQAVVEQGGALDLLLTENFITGATMAFRACWKPLILPFPRHMSVIHDGWIAMAIACVSDVAFSAEPLLQYRQHAQQQIGVAPFAATKSWRDRVLPRDYYLGHIGQLEALRDRLAAYDVARRPQTAALMTRIPTHIAHIEARLALPANKISRLPRVLRELSTRRYHRFSSGWKSAARDLFF